MRTGLTGRAAALVFAAMPLLRDPRIILPLLAAARPASESVYNLVTGAAGVAARRIWVDDCDRPRAVVVRTRRQALFALDPRSAGAIVRSLPRNLRLAFGSTPARFRPVITRNWPGRRSSPRAWVTPCWQYHLPPGRLVVDRVHKVVSLKPEDAPAIARRWPYGRRADHIRERIAAMPGCGVRVRGRLVAWALVHDDGSMGFLHVLDGFRGQGMARSLTTALAGRLLRLGFRPFLYIVRGNTASIRLTESMGFVRSGGFDWFGA